MPQTALVQITERRAEEALAHQGERVLRCACALPRVRGLSERAQRRVNRYYIHLERAFLAACRGRLLSLAGRAAEAAHAQALPFVPDRKSVV